jgi:ribonuclease P protein component
MPASGRPARLRLGISVPRRVGAAVARNRVRRRLREIFRRSRMLFLPDSASLVVNARPSAAAASFRELSEDFEAAVRRASARLTRT